MSVKITIEAVQHTPFHEPVLVQYSADAGPLAHSTLFHTTQKALGGAVWGDAEIMRALLAHLAEHGIEATIVIPVEPSVPDPAPDAIAS